MRRRRSFKTAPPMVKILRLLGFIVSLIIQNYTTANGKIHNHKFVVSTSLSLYSSLLLLFISSLIQLLLQVKSASFTRLCNTKEILTVNGKFPGPTLEAYTGDELIVTVYNRAKYNITLHWYVLPCLRTKIQTVFLQKIV